MVSAPRKLSTVNRGRIRPPSRAGDTVTWGGWCPSAYREPAFEGLCPLCGEPSDHFFAYRETGDGFGPTSDVRGMVSTQLAMFGGWFDRDKSQRFRNTGTSTFPRYQETIFGGCLLKPDLDPDRRFSGDG
jgi:hypothetical protein